MLLIVLLCLIILLKTQTIDNQACIDFSKIKKPITSRVPINDTREINREYYYNNTWLKNCNKTDAP